MGCFGSATEAGSPEWFNNLSMGYIIEKYNPSLKEEWDIFVSNARNATFLFRRDYMDYHSDRFEDFSLVARNGKGNIVALLPANRDDSRPDLLVSHGGLTYGGWLGDYRHFDILALLEIQGAANRFLAGCGITELIYKPVPFIYSEIPSEEDLYMLFRNGAKLVGRQISSAINLLTDAGPDYERRRKARVARHKGMEIRESADFAPFWEILTELIEKKFGRPPVHSLDEIKLLHTRFPDNIRHFTIWLDGELLGGTVIYHCGGVAHSQYIAATDRGKRLNAVVLLHDHIIDLYRSLGYHWFDFGISTEDGGRYLNEGLVRQKISYGGRGVVYDIYSIPIPPC